MRGQQYIPNSRAYPLWPCDRSFVVGVYVMQDQLVNFRLHHLYWRVVVYIFQVLRIYIMQIVILILKLFGQLDAFPSLGNRQRLHGLFGRKDAGLQLNLSG